LKEYGYQPQDALIQTITKDIAYPKELMKKENNKDLLEKLKTWEEGLVKYK
jgi:hypothetical protein